MKQADAARVGIGGPVGSGKTALIEALIPRLQGAGINVAVVTNDLVTAEDALRLQNSGLIDRKLVRAVEAGACPHTVIREDPTLNIAAADDLVHARPDLDLILIESGGDNLASTFSLDLVDWWAFVIDVGQGDDIPRKRGPGLMQADLLVINKVDLAPHVGVDAAAIEAEAREIRAGRPVIACQVGGQAAGKGVDELVDLLREQVLFSNMEPV